MEGSSIYGMVLDPMKPSHSEGKGDRRGSIRVVAFSTAPVHRSLKDVLARNVTRAHLRDRQATAPSFLWKCRGCFFVGTNSRTECPQSQHRLKYELEYGYHKR